MVVKTQQEAAELFGRKNANGESNNYFLAFRNMSKAGGILSTMNKAYDALLINCTEHGLAMFYLTYNGLSLTNNPDMLKINENVFFFYPDEQIRSVTIKKYALLNNKIKAVTIVTTAGQKFDLQVNVSEKTIPYHQSGFAAFMEKYGN